jgi:hypothetical protein
MNNTAPANPQYQKFFSTRWLGCGARKIMTNNKPDEKTINGCVNWRW